MQAIQARMKYLRKAEAICAFALPAAFWFSWKNSAEAVDWIMRGAAAALVSYILLQGATYWHLKLQGFAQRQPLPAGFHKLFNVFKYSNLLAICAVALLLFNSRPSASGADLAWTAGLLGFAVLEQVNYYHYQLMYDTGAAFAYLRRNGRLREAALALDLKRAKASIA